MPGRVQHDLPRAAETIRKAGLSIPMATTDIRDTQSPHAEAIVTTLAARELTIPKDKLLAITRYDLDVFKPLPHKAGLG